MRNYIIIVRANNSPCIKQNKSFLKNFRYKKYRKTVIGCRRKCQQNVADFTPIFMENINDFHFYEKKIRETLCLLKCNQDYRDIAGATSLRRLPHETEKKILDLKPYEYLHICYYQVIINFFF